MRLGCCGGADRLDAIRDAGYDYIEPSVFALRTDLSEEDFAPIRHRFSRAGIRAEAFNVFIPGDLKITGESVDLPALRQQVETATRRAASLGAEIIVFGSGGARHVPEGFPHPQALEQLAGFCSMAAELGALRGIKIVIEPLSATKCNLINSLAEGAALVEQVSHPGFALLADLYHMELDDEPWENLAAHVTHLRHVHVPVPEIDVLTTTGEPFSHVAFMKALKEAGYDGRITIEDNGKRFADLATEAQPVADRIRDLWAAV